MARNSVFMIGFIAGACGVVFSHISADSKYIRFKKSFNSRQQTQNVIIDLLDLDVVLLLIDYNHVR